MEAPTLTRAEQRAALRKIKKKKIFKNVLNFPKHLKVQSLVTTDSEEEKLKNILERLLPSARLPTQQNLKCMSITSEGTALKETAQLRRKQLSIGVNDLNKSIKNGSVLAALLASDIEPKFLTHHLNLLCSHNKIPHMHMVGLREITRKCLGFPCIALGFKSNSDFSEAIHKIRTLSLSLKGSENCKKSDTGVTDSERIIEQKGDKENDELPFTYLYRTSKKERIFVPENQDRAKKADGFIQIPKEADVIPNKEVSAKSFHLVKKKSKKKLEIKDDSSSEADFEVPRKKSKKNWATDSKGNNEKLRYHSVNLVKVSSNPNRISRKRKF